ncbi:hypothetical protein, partial [Staphylococcus epidermidis]|uniref:hypothetical protein n=1 Tax=Staphylococcus epidermidis TaxID=1282 RepID=UPI0016425042
QIQQQENVTQNLNQQVSEIKQQGKDVNEKMEINESEVEKCDEDILCIENHYEDIKGKESKVDVLIKDGIDDLNETYEVRVEGGRMEYDRDET